MNTQNNDNAQPAGQPPSCALTTGSTILPPLNEELAWILGRPCFAVARIGRRLHDLGLYVVDTKAEAEQAAAIHSMLGLYLKHGDGWREVAESTLKAGSSNAEVTQ
jgi:hypothetical protein